MRFLTRSLRGLLIMALTLGLLGTAVLLVAQALSVRATQTGPARAPSERMYAADVLTLEFRDLTPQMTAYGEIRSTRRLEVRASGSGRIIALSPDFKDGARVAQGDVLVRLDPAQYRAARDSARASVSDAQSALAEAERALVITNDDLEAARRQASLRQRAFERQRDLNTRGLGSAVTTEEAELAASSADQAVLGKRAALSLARSTRDQSQIALERAEIDLREADRVLAETEIRAGFQGILSQVAAVEGGLVSDNEMLAELIDPNALEVVFRVSTTQFVRLTDPDGALRPLSAEVRLQSASGEIRSDATLVRVGAAVEAGVAGRLIFARLDAPQGFRPGDFATVIVQEPTLDRVARLPAQAVNGNAELLALGPEDRLRTVQAEVLRREGDTILVRADVAPDTEVVARRTPLLGDGIRLRPIRSGDQGAASDVPRGTPAQAVEDAALRDNRNHPAMVTLTPAHRARLKAQLEAAKNLSPARKSQIAQELEATRVPAATLAQIAPMAGG
ncbi:HlyD family efflux transporter periplasmic adaptor subunit [Rhodobacteraceae bacterium]|nr:HlyD family efflux transporter periplasmic adaptor subunit [Paracoccaceae bacterium]